MARRATILKRYSSNSLIIAGYYEFLPEYDDVVTEDTKTMIKVFKELPYKFVAIRDNLAAALSKQGIKLGPKFVVVGDKEVVKKFKFKGVDVFLVFFPDVKPSELNKRFGSFQNIFKGISDTMISIAVVPWGYDFEQKFLNTSSHKPNILLGGGEGSSFLGRNAGSIWVHPTSRGRCLYHVFSRRGKFLVNRIDLGEDISEDPTIKAMLK